MSYPQQTFATIDDLLAYVNTDWVTNGIGEITGIVGNNVQNGHVKFIKQSPLNWNKAAIVGQSSPYTVTSAITVFFGASVPSSVTFGDNIYNEWVFVNTTGSAISLASPLGYFDITFTFTNVLPAGSVVRISKATNNLWVLTGMYGNAISPSTPKPIIGIVGRGQSQDPTAGTAYYINSSLIQFAAANGYQFVIDVNGATYQNFGTNGNQFVFDETTGRIDFDPFSFVWENGGSLYIDRNQ